MSRKEMFYWQSDRPFSAQEINEIFLQRTRHYDKAVLMQAAAAAYGEEIGKLSEPIAFGSVNIVCPFVTKSGEEGVIRAHPGQVKNEYFYSEKLAMEAAVKVGVLAPTVATVDDSRTLVPFDYMVMTKVPGQVMPVALEQNPSLYPTFLYQLGEQLASLHSINTNGYGFFDNDQARNGNLVGIHANNESHYSSALLADEKFHYENRYWMPHETVAKAIKILQSNVRITKCDKPTLVQNDIADWNTVVKGDKVTGILDWDECFSGDPVFEFATLSLFYSDEQMKMLLEGYQSVRALPADYQDKISLYTLRYIINKSKISINKLKSVEKESTRIRFNNSISKLTKLVKELI